MIKFKRSTNQQNHPNPLQLNPKSREKWNQSTLRSQLTQRSQPFEASNIECERSAGRRNPTESGSFESEKASEAQTVAIEKTADAGVAGRIRSIDFKTSIGFRIRARAINIENDKASDQKAPTLGSDLSLFQLNLPSRPTRTRLNPKSWLIGEAQANANGFSPRRNPKRKALQSRSRELGGWADEKRQTMVSSSRPMLL
jgi:hypothetical protein